MIIYGTRASHLSTEQIKNESCPQCGTQDSVFMSLFVRYVHIFWIPLFPFGKKAVSQCQNCKQVLETKNMPQGFKNHLATQKTTTRTPLWSFSGLALILIFAGWMVIEGENNKKQEQAYLASPMLEDVFEIKNGDHYSTFKIIGFENDSIAISYNVYETNKITGISEIDKKENYNTEEYYLIPKAQLQTWYDDGTIYDINRN